MPINWKDKYYFSDRRIVLTSEQLHIPGVQSFGMDHSSKATSPLEEHYHKDVIEITYIVKGNFIFSTNHQDYNCSGGDAFIAYPNEPHSTHNMPMYRGKIFWIQLDIKHPDNFLFLEKNYANTIIQKLLRIQQHLIHTDNKEICTMISKSFFMVQPFNNPTMAACYLSLFLHLLIQFSEKPHYYSISPDIQRALYYIYNHIQEDISLDTLAKYSHLSTSRFKAKFNEQLGMSPREFINLKKIELSKKMLKNGQKVTDTAISLGFSSSSYFAATFKKYTTLTPKEYIQKNKFNDSETP